MPLQVFEIYFLSNIARGVTVSEVDELPKFSTKSVAHALRKPGVERESVGSLNLWTFK